MNPFPLAAAAFRFQLSLVRRSPGDLMVLVNTPLLTVAFLTITRHAGRPDLDGYAVLAPAVMALFNMAVMVAGEIVDVDRWLGTLELLLAAPAALPVVVLGRIGAVTVLSLGAVGEAWLVARLGFGVHLTVAHPGLFAATLLVTALATAGWATAMSGTFVLARSARTFQNTITYPFLLLGGALVPVELLPAWLRPISRLVYLSWASDLLRATLRPEPVRLFLPLAGVVLGLGAAGFALGWWLLRRIVDLARTTGTVTYA